MDHIRCNIFKNAWDTDGSNIVHVLSVMEAIESGRWKDKIDKIRSLDNKEEIDQVKKTLPCVTFSGIFSQRKEAHIIEYTHLYVVDFDEIKKKDLPMVKERLSGDPYIGMMFYSPSKGLKALVEVDSELIDHRDYAYEALESYFKQTYGIQMDTSGKDPTRLCFVSYDPEVYYNGDYKVFHVDKEEVNRFRSVDVIPDNTNWESSNDLRHVFKVCDKMVRGSKVGGYHKGNRNKFIYTLSCTLNRAGVDQTDAEQLVWRRYDTLEFKEVAAAVNSAYKHRKGEHATKPIMQKKSPQIGLFKRKDY